MRELTKKEIKLELERLVTLADSGCSTIVSSTSIKEDIDYLRMCILYSKFDLEATERELRVAKGLEK